MARLMNAFIRPELYTKNCDGGRTRHSAPRGITYLTHLNCFRGGTIGPRRRLRMTLDASSELAPLQKKAWPSLEIERGPCLFLVRPL